MPSADDTESMQAVEDDGVERTAEMEAQAEDDLPVVLTDLDDTGVNEELTEEMLRTEGIADVTAELPTGDADSPLRRTGAHTDLTTELPTAENDPTVEMDVESGTFKTGSGRFRTR